MIEVLELGFFVGRFAAEQLVEAESRDENGKQQQNPEQYFRTRVKHVGVVAAENVVEQPELGAISNTNWNAEECWD